MSEADKPKRKHVRTGTVAAGGARPGAGRPKGSTSALPHGAVSGLKALRYRVPDDAPDAVKAVADEAFQGMVDVLRDRGNPLTAQSRLKAATAIRLEVCGAPAQRVSVTGKDGESLPVINFSVSGITKEDE